jgi:hypothetical protein
MLCMQAKLRGQGGFISKNVYLQSCETVPLISYYTAVFIVLVGFKVMKASNEAEVPYASLEFYQCHFAILTHDCTQCTVKKQ